MLSPGGLVTMAMMFVVGRLTGSIQPKYLIATGATIVALSMYDLTNLYGDLNFGFFAWSRMLLGVGLPLIFIPILTASYEGIPPGKTDQASALINAARNIGGSIGVSLAVNVLALREQFHQSRLAEHVVPSSIQYQETLQQVTEYFAAHGSSLDASPAAGFRLDRAAGADAGRAAGLYRHVLDPDADLGRGRAARARPAQGQARGGRRAGTLTIRMAAGEVTASVSTHTSG